MQTKRQMQKGGPNQVNYQASMKWPIKKKEHMVGTKRKRGTTNKKPTF